MSKILDNKIVKNILLDLVIVAAVALGIMAFLPDSASAYDGFFYSDPYNASYYGGTGYNSNLPRNNNTISSNTSYIDYGLPQNNFYGNTSPATSTKKTSTSTSRSTSNTVNNDSNTSDNTRTPGQEVSYLAGNAVYGSNSFLPSGLIGWLLVIVFILLLIVAWRSIAARQAYHDSPMKHA